MITLALLALAQVPLPGTSSVTVSLSPPRACGRCHSGFDGSAYDTWAASVMGNAVRDPLYLAALQIADRDVPGVGDLCLRCHAPEAWLQGRCLPTDASAIDPINDSGVTCSFCHRSEPNPYQRNGQYIVADDSVLRGPYTDAKAPHTNRYTTWISDAALCGTCHDLWNPLVERKDLAGRSLGYGFPEQTTFSEWKASAFADPADPMAKDCKGCHMPEDVSIVAQNGPERPDRSNHGIAGANTWLLDAVELLYPELGLAERFAEGRARIRAVLSEAAELSLVDPPAEVARGEPVTLVVRVTNLTGHKLPTGYPEGRSVYLTARSATLGVDLGALDPASGEPVRPLAIYRAIQGQAGVGASHHIALNDTIYFDNRIPPRGFVSTSSLAPVGKSYPELSPGVLAHYDELTLTATVPCRLDLDRVEGELALWSQVIQPRYVETLIAETASIAPERSDTLRVAYEGARPAPERMELLRFSIPIAPSSRCAPPDAGVIDTGIDDRALAPDAASSPRDVGPIVDVADAGVVAPDPEGGCDCGSARPKGEAAFFATLLVLAVRRRRGAR